MFAWVATTTVITAMVWLLVWLIWDVIKDARELKATRQKFIKQDIANARRPPYIHPYYRRDPHDEDWF